MATTETIINWFKNTKNKKVMVDDVEYPTIRGTETGGGWYVNGFNAKVVAGNKGKRNYLQIDIYTSAAHVIDIEEKYLFAMIGDKYKLVKWVGWNDVNLMRGTWKNEYMDMLKATYNKYG